MHSTVSGNAQTSLLAGVGNRSDVSTYVRSAGRGLRSALQLPSPSLASLGIRHVLITHASHLLSTAAYSASHSRPCPSSKTGTRRMGDGWRLRRRAKLRGDRAVRKLHVLRTLCVITCAPELGPPHRSPRSSLLDGRAHVSALTAYREPLWHLPGSASRCPGGSRRKQT